MMIHSTENPRWRTRLMLARRQAARSWRRYLKWPLIGVVWLFTLALGYIGFYRFSVASGQPASVSDLFYLTLQLFVLQSGAVLGPKGWELEVARFLAPTLAAYTAIQALAAVFSDQLLSLRLTLIHDHIVICGLGRKGYLLAQGFRARGDRVVVIERDEDDEQIGLCREQGIAVLIGDATDPNLLRQARVPRARAVFALFGDDGANADVAVHTRELAASHPGRGFTCVLHIVDPQLYALFREQELPVEQVGTFRQEFFNVFDHGARVLLKQYPPFDEIPECHPHPLVIGLGRMGQSLLVHMARSWRGRFATTGERLRVTVLDRDAQRHVESLCLRYPQLGKVCDLRAVSMEIQSPDFQRAEFLFGPDGVCDVTIAYICLDDDSLGLYTALALRQRIRGTQLPIVVRMAQDTGLAALLRRTPASQGSFQGLYAFGLLDQTCTPELVLGGTHESLARAIHEDYVRRKAQEGHTQATRPSMIPWDQLPERLKESNRQQADHIGAKLAAIGCGIAPLSDWDAESFSFSPDEVEVMAELEYLRYTQEREPRTRRWCLKRARTGAGLPVQPWDDLSEGEKEENRSEVRSIPALLAQAGFEVCRPCRPTCPNLPAPAPTATPRP